MGLELKKESMKIGKKLCEKSFEQRLEQDITLPDYCADIKKILRCSVVPGIHTVGLSGEKATAKGTGVIRVLYIAEGDKTDAFEKSCDLSASAQLKELPADAVVTASSTVDFVNCRATGQRKISVSAGISTAFSCFSGENEDFAVKGENPCVQVKTEKLLCENHLGYFEKTFDMNETVVLNSEHLPIGKIAGCTYRCVPGAHKLSSGKLLIKGDVTAEICYIPEKGENKFCTFTHSMPVSQILDVGQLPDKAVCDVKLKVCQFLCNVKADSSGANRLAELSVRVSAFVKADEKKECEVITDCYCTDFEAEEKFESSGLRCHVREINEARQTKGEIEFSSAVKEICFARCLEITHNIKYTEDKAQFDCSALVFIMYTDENGIVSCCEKNVDFDFDYAVVKKCTDPYGEFTLEPLSLSAVLNGTDRAEIILDFNVSGKICCSFEGKILKNLTVFEDKPKSDKGAALTLYFAETGEKLWDIARMHNTTVELISRENGLKKDSIGENTMLMIPCI